MIEINLLPAGEKKRRSAGRAGAARRGPALPQLPGDPYTIGLGAVAVLLFVGMGFAYWRMDTGRTAAEARVEQAKQDSIRFASTIQLVSALEARQDTIESKIGVIRGVDERRYVWPHLLDEISRALPPYTWLTKVAAAEAEPPPPPPTTAADSAAAAAAPSVPAGPAFSLEGNTGSTQALTRFMKGLEASPFIRDVTLVTSEQTSTDGRTYQKFTLEARYEVPDSSFVETVPVISLR
ncbi:MAG TPA: PilN domain-containing protein [Longimicrobiaceae bacterium]|nr:PilN domain-containing protein [Longimicrobiaceae bacterium]